jgi:hypothetical protein
LGIVAASLLAEGIDGITASAIGWKRVLACLAGLGIVASGILLPVARQPISAVAVRWIVAAYVASCSFVIWLVDPLLAATWILLGYAAAICLLLPLRFGILTLIGMVALNWMLTWISRIKVDLTGLPLTMLDLRIAVGNPEGLWDALSLPHWSRHIAVAATFLALLGWVLTGLLTLGRRLRGAATFESLGRLLAVSVLGIVMWTSLQSLYRDMGRDDTTWYPDRVARLAGRAGILPFLGYSYHIESRAIGDIYRSDGSSLPPSPEDVRQSVLQYISFLPEGGPKGTMQPNVVIVLAESTFDPSRAFRLQGEWNADLFTENELTAAAGALRVNTKGGGTWVAEFETITGLDSRLFGYSGAYTHASLSPFVERSFANYMEKRGYETWAFLANRGNFYNSRRAYESYGFRHILDSEDLGSESEWFDTDTAVIESVKSSLGPDPAAPFFSYIMLIENHSPHECDVPGTGSFAVRFSDTAEFAANCALHEYLRRLDSTTTAVQTLIHYLEDIEERTSRPFVLLTFGDHQPSTFTGSGEFLTDFAPFRTSQDMYTTFFHVLSSTATRLQCCSAALPVAALPTLVSGFVASGPDDIYLGENLWLYARCGSNAIRQDFADHMTSLDIHASGERTDACEAAYPRAVAAYRSAGIVRLTADRSASQ